jgi:hypothetical protein
MEHLKNSELVRRYEAIEKKISALNGHLIVEGLGGMTPAGIRRMENKSKTVVEFLKLLDEAQDIIAEAKRRYGPDLITVRQLVWKK